MIQSRQKDRQMDQVKKYVIKNHWYWWVKMLDVIIVSRKAGAWMAYRGDFHFRPCSLESVSSHCQSEIEVCYFAVKLLGLVVTSSYGLFSHVTWGRSTRKTNSISNQIRRERETERVLGGGWWIAGVVRIICHRSSIIYLFIIW